MTKDETLKMLLVHFELWNHGDSIFYGEFDYQITAIKEALAQPEQPKYRRGNRLVCLETDEYCVIHISGTDRQWVKFPDSHIGVYTNEQVAELFELLPKEPEPWEKFCDSNCVWTDHHPDCKLAERTWVGLTDEEISELIRATHNTGSFVRAIEAKLKEKNNG